MFLYGSASIARAVDDLILLHRPLERRGDPLLAICRQNLFQARSLLAFPSAHASVEDCGSYVSPCERRRHVDIEPKSLRYFLAVAGMIVTIKLPRGENS